MSGKHSNSKSISIFDGQVYALSGERKGGKSGGSVNHSRISIKITAMLDAHVSDRNCIAGNSDLKVNIVNTQNYTYPDASVTCAIA